MARMNNQENRTIREKHRNSLGAQLAGMLDQPNAHPERDYAFTVALCYGMRSWTYSFHCTFTAVNCWFSFHIHCSPYLLHWHVSIHCVVVNSPFFLFLTNGRLSPKLMTRRLVPLSHPHSMTFQHVLPLGLCVYLGYINTAPTCTISLKLVLVFASNLLLLSLFEGSSFASSST